MSRASLWLQQRKLRNPQQHPLNLKRNESFWISIAALVSPYVGTVLIVMGAEKSGLWICRIGALPVIAAFQNHLQILLHEGAHFQIHPERKWNDLWTDLFCAIPFFGFVRHYRHFHLAHHRHLLDPERDPEIEFYADQGHFFERKRPAALLKMLILDLCGYHYFQFFFAYNSYLVQEVRAKRMRGLASRDWLLLSGALAMGIGFILSTNGFFLLAFYWFLPQPTFLFLFLKLQGYGEHTQRSTRVEDCTLTHELGLPARFFIYPLNSDLHLEHHLYPSVPWYRLRELRSALRHEATRADSAGSTDGYFFGRKSILKSLLITTS
ncbi:MAG: fatty acid desaturase family protein [Bdellovibrionia bacterium]